MTNLVASGVTQTGEQRGEFAAEGRRSILLEDDLVESTCGGNLKRISVSNNNSAPIQARVQSHPGLVAHQSLRSGVDLKYHVNARQSSSRDH